MHIIYVCTHIGPDVDNEERMVRRMNAIEGECIKLEEELEAALEKVVTLEREVMEKADLVSALRNLVEKPDPVVDFGGKGDTYSAKAFRFLSFFSPPPLLTCLCACFQARLQGAELQSHMSERRRLTGGHLR